MKTITKVCKHCNKDFEASLREHKRGNAHFCNQSCASSYCAAQKPKPESNCTCAACDKQFYRNKTKQKNSRSGLQFCSRKCKDESQRIGGIEEIQPPHYGITSSRYRTIAFKNLPHECNRCGYDKHLAGLVVHHMDGNRSNNQLNNLEIICAICHAIEHWS